MQYVIDCLFVDFVIVIFKQIQIVGFDVLFMVLLFVQVMFFDLVEVLIYWISDGEQEFVGDLKLLLQGINVCCMYYVYVFEVEYDNCVVWVVQVCVDDVEGGKLMVVEVVQLVWYCYWIVVEFFVVIMMLLFLLLFVGWGIVWCVVNQQFGLFMYFVDLLNWQIYMLLELVDEIDVLLEIWLLMSVMNVLFGCLKIVFDVQCKFIVDVVYQLCMLFIVVKLYVEQVVVVCDLYQIFVVVCELCVVVDCVVWLFNQLLLFVCVELGEQVVCFVDVDFVVMVFEMGVEWVLCVFVLYVDFGFQCSDDLGDDEKLIVCGNLVLLCEVIVNLFDNVLKYVLFVWLDGVWIMVNVVCVVFEGNQLVVEIVVEDNGFGVFVNQQVDLFKCFFCGDV